MDERLRVVLRVLLLLALSVTPANAAPITLHFTNNEVNLGNNSVINLEGHEFGAFGITMTNVYRYVDSRDPFSDAPNQISESNAGIAAQIESSGLARIDFDAGTSFVTFDWWTVSEDHVFNLRAFDSSNNLIGSFLEASGSGTHTISGPISYVTFNDGGGFAPIANLSYDRVNSPPVLNVADQAGTEGVLLTFQVSATDADVSDTVTLSVSNLPLGATFDETTGTFAWTPDFAQGGPNPYIVQFSAYDGHVIVTKSARITIADVEGRPDEDGDGVPDDVDNCPEDPNPTQANVCQNSPEPTSGTVTTAAPGRVPVVTYHLTVTAPGNTDTSWAAPGLLTGTVQCRIFDSSGNEVPPEQIPEIGTQVLDEDGGIFIRVPAGQTVTLSGEYDPAFTNPTLPEGDYRLECGYRNFTTRPDPQPGDPPIWVGEVPATIVNIRVTDSIVAEFFLHGPTLFLDLAAPTGATAQFKDAGAAFALGNPWREVGTWSASPSFVDGVITGLSQLQVWLGLKNSDDQGVRFDLRAEIYKNGAVAASGETRCVTGLTRNPGAAKKVTVPFGAFPPVTFDGTADTLRLKILTRIGTTPSGTKCEAHSSGTLRLYFDAVNRNASFSTTP